MQKLKAKVGEPEVRAGKRNHCGVAEKCLWGGVRLAGSEGLDLILIWLVVGVNDRQPRSAAIQAQSVVNTQYFAAFNSKRKSYMDFAPVALSVADAHQARVRDILVGLLQ